MINQVIVKIQQLPKLLLGFLVILIVMVGLYLQDPPKGLCDIQVQSIQTRLKKGFYSDKSDGIFGHSANSAKSFCLRSNSPGGCLDLFNRFSFFEKQIRTLPPACGSHSAAGSLRSILTKALKLFAEVGWGDEPPQNKYNKSSWLDTHDIGLFCRLKQQYQRLYGKAAWQQLAWGVISRLPDVKTLKKREQWDRSLFSYPCKGLY